MKKEKFPIQGWKWIFYVIGWITGALSLVFWIYQVMSYAINRDKRKPKDFFSADFHNRVVYWGVFITVVVILIAILVLLAVAMSSSFRLMG